MTFAVSQSVKHIQLGVSSKDAALRRQMAKQENLKKRIDLLQGMLVKEDEVLSDAK